MMCLFLANHSAPTLAIQGLLVLPVILISSVLLFAPAAAAQDATCRLKLDDLPRAAELKGFHLGMTMDEVKAQAPQVVFPKTDELGLLKTSISPGFDPRSENSTFQDVRTVSFDFLDQRLTSLWIGYDQTFKWQTVDEFVNGISQSLHLPNAWSSWKTHGKELRCVDFQMTVSTVAGSPSFRILDQKAEETLTARRIAQEEERAALEENDHSDNAIVGEKNARVYYTAECPPAKEIDETRRVIFKTAAEAEKAGYKRATNCQ
jgi:hypothetical protein